MDAPTLMYALCTCRDGQHTRDGGRDRFKANRADAEAVISLVGGADGPVHLVQSTLIMTEVEFADPRLAATRRDILADFAARYGHLPVDVEGGCNCGPKDACDICGDVYDLPGKRVAS